MAAAQSGGMRGMDMKMDKKGAVHKATGTVTKVDKDKVTIKHGPVESMKWPAMSMTFKVGDKAMLDKLAKEQKVEFEFVQQGKDYVITEVK
jgi:Cu(I)/Ag(I) efflux system protein CusF